LAIPGPSRFLQPQPGPSSSILYDVSDFFRFEDD
jgi:hypothetical protein